MGHAGIAAAAAAAVRLEDIGLRYTIVDSGKHAHLRDRCKASDVARAMTVLVFSRGGKFSFFNDPHIWDSESSSRLTAPFPE